MFNQWHAFEEEEDNFELKFTSNPIRKLKKKLRKKNERYKQNPTQQLFNEISKLNTMINHLTSPESFKPKKKNKNKKFKKYKVNKAEIAAEKKRKKDKERADRFKFKYNNERKEKKDRAYGIPIFKLKQKHLSYSLPKDIRDWIKEPTKKGYYILMKKYHPDKNKNIDNDYVKVITSHWNNIINI